MRGVMWAVCALAIVAVGCAKAPDVPHEPTAPFDQIAGQLQPGDRAVVAGPDQTYLVVGSEKELTGAFHVLMPGVETRIGYDAGPSTDKPDPDTGEVKGRRLVQVTAITGPASGESGLVSRDALRRMAP